MVAGRVRDDAAAALLVGELRDHVVGAANLEGAARLQALALQQERPPGRGRDVEQRRDARNRRHARGRGADVVERDELVGGVGKGGITMTRQRGATVAVGTRPARAKLARRCSAAGLSRRNSWD